MSTLSHQPLAAGSLSLTEDRTPERNCAEFSRAHATQATFAIIARTFGVAFVPDLFMGMGAKPAYLETAWELFTEDLPLEQVDVKTKRMIALALSTTASGHYCITEYPHAFRLNALDKTTCDKIVSIIRFFHSFDRYLSGVMPPYSQDTPTFGSAYLRDEYWGFEETRPTNLAPSGEDGQPGRGWIGGMLIIIFLLLPIAAGIDLVVT